MTKVKVVLLLTDFLEIVWRVAVRQVRVCVTSVTKKGEDVKIVPQNKTLNVFDGKKVKK